MPTRFFDSHTHVQFRAFESDRREVINRALETGVWMINIGTQRDTSVAALALANEYSEGVYASVGLHPIHTEKSYHDEQELGLPSSTRTDAENTQTDEDIPRESAYSLSAVEGSSPRESELRGFMSRGEEFDYAHYLSLARDPKVVAIGECGLDYYRGKGEEERGKQRRAFLQQIELAREVEKPLMIHCREAFNDLIEILNSKSYILNSRQSVVHFFSGTVEDARQLLNLGFSFTFGGVITFTRDYDEAIKIIPLDRILSETDAPYVAPVPYRGKRNEPAYVVEVVKRIAELKDLSLDEVAHASFQNAARTFGLPL